MSVTLFPSTFATSASETPWHPDRITNLIRYQSARTKDSLPMIKLARFGQVRTNHGCLRSDANLIEVTGVEGDYDAGERTVEWAAHRLRGIEALVYTTASHSVERPRWRVLAPFSTGREPGTRDSMVSRVNGVLEGVLAQESWNLSQAYYYGSVRGRPLCEVIRVEGTPIDLIEGLVEVGKPLGDNKDRPDDVGPVVGGDLPPNPGLVSKEVTIWSVKWPQTVPRWSPEESVGWKARNRAMNELMRTQRGGRNYKLNGEAYALGRLVVRGWLSGGVAVWVLGHGARSCGYVRDYGEWDTVRAIRHGLLDGMRRPYPDLRYRPEGPVPSLNTKHGHFLTAASSSAFECVCAPHGVCVHRKCRECLFAPGTSESPQATGSPPSIRRSPIASAASASRRCLAAFFSIGDR